MNRWRGLVMALVLGAAGLQAQEVHLPAPSTWELDVSHSEFGGLPAPRSRTLTITSDKPEKLTFRGSGKTDRGKKEIFYWNGPEDGTMRRVRGTGSKASFGKNGKSHWSLQGGSLEDDELSVSEDGKTMTMAGTLKERNGTEHKRKLVYARVK